MSVSHRQGTWVHVLFLAGLLAAYLLTLFGAAHLSDVHFVGHDFARLAAVLLELVFVGLVMAWPLRQWRAGRRARWFVVYMLLAALLCTIYVAQVYALYLSNNFVSVLALQNLDSAWLVEDPIELVFVIAGAAWVLLLGWCTWRLPARTSPGGYGRLLAFAVIGLAYVWLFTMQRHHVSLEPDYRQVPLASLVVNARLALDDAAPAVSPPPVAAGAAVDAACFQDPDAGGVAGYPFQKDEVYQTPLRFAHVPGTPVQPNVIVIFTEGLSARLLGAYGGPYAGLTPNIDSLARRSMQVTDYFNHTAATYRGLIGQNTSGFAFNGGGTGGWDNSTNAARLALIERASLADILGARGYDTVFFSPHTLASPFGRMLRALGFKDLYGLGQIPVLLPGRDVIDPTIGDIDDAGMYAGLEAWLKQRQAGGTQQPFYAGFYNIGTHAFISMVAGGKGYAAHPNRFLDKLHNYDAALGPFLGYFFHSPYARNTILVFTTDHATYPDKVYRDVAGDDLAPFFVDRIPLLIYDPTHRLPATFDAQARNSLDLAPTLLQLLGIRRVPNSFLGHSLFEPRSFPVGITALGDEFYVTLPSGVVPLWAAPAKVKPAAECERAVVMRYYQLESANRLFTPTPRTAIVPALASTIAAPPVAALAAPKVPAMGSPLCALDALNGRTLAHDGHDVDLPQGKSFLTKGWMVDARHRAVSEMRIELSAVHGGAPRTFAAGAALERPDVVQAIQSLAALKSGFRVAGNSAGLGPGRYRVQIQGVEEGKEVVTCDSHVTFRVGAAAPTRGRAEKSHGS